MNGKSFGRRGEPQRQLSRSIRPIETVAQSEKRSLGRSALLSIAQKVKLLVQVVGVHDAPVLEDQNLLLLTAFESGLGCGDCYIAGKGHMKTKYIRQLPFVAALSLVPFSSCCAMSAFQEGMAKYTNVDDYFHVTGTEYPNKTESYSVTAVFQPLGTWSESSTKGTSFFDISNKDGLKGLGHQSFLDNRSVTFPGDVGGSSGDGGGGGNIPSGDFSPNFPAPIMSDPLATPLPTTLLLFAGGLGLGFVGYLMRRKKRKMVEPLAVA